MAYRLVGYILRAIKILERRIIARPAREVLDKQVDDHGELIADLVKHPEVQYTKNVKHHEFHSRFDHMMLASKFAYYFANKIGADVKVCVRAAAIHDVWGKGMYCQPSVDFAKKIGESQGVQDAIETHMVLKKAPRTKEQWVVAWADECAWGVESLEYLRLSLKSFLGWVAEISPANIK